MIFVDSSVWIDWLRGAPTPEAEYLNQALMREPLVVGDLVLVEVLQGISDAVQFRRTRERLLSLIVIEVGGIEIALQAAEYHRTLRSRGVTPRRTIDTLIAARCIRDGWSLLAKDRDFTPFAEHFGLRLIAAH